MAGGMNPGIVFNLQRSVLSENDVWVCTCHFFKKIRLTPIPLKKVFFFAIISFVIVKHFLKEVVCSWFLKKYNYKEVSRLDGFKVNES